MTRFEITIHADESGTFEASADNEPWVIAAIAHPSGSYSLTEAGKDWEALGLGPPDEFHANTWSPEDRPRLDAAAEALTRMLRRRREVELVPVIYWHRASRLRSRHDSWPDVVLHAVVRASRRFMDRRWRARPWAEPARLRIEVNLARRFAINVAPFEDAAARGVRTTLAELASSPKHTGLRVDPRRTNIHIGLVPVSLTPYHAMSDLLCNWFFRHARGRGSLAHRLPYHISPSSLERWLDDGQWARIVHPPSASPREAGIARRVEGALSASAPPWSFEDLERAGLGPALTPEERGLLVRALLEAAEDDADVVGDFRRAEARLDLVRRLLKAKSYGGIAEELADRLALDIDNVRLAISNHEGRQLPKWFESRSIGQRSARLMADGNHHAAVSLLHNRAAVAALNRLDFAGAEDQVGAQVKRVRRQRAEVVEAFGGEPGVSAEFGALLGTWGQSLAFLGHIRGDALLADLAGQVFGEAVDHFDAPLDVRRQWNYAGHLALDGLRSRERRELPAIWPNLLELFDDDARRWVEDPMGPGARGQAFGLQLLLKDAWLRGGRPDFVDGVVRAFAGLRHPNPLPHPLQQVAGLAVLVADLPLEHPAMRALQETASADRTLVGLIARVYELEVLRVRGRLEDSMIASVGGDAPSWLRAAWREQGLQGRLEASASAGSSLLDALPFNYA